MDTYCQYYNVYASGGKASRPSGVSIPSNYPQTGNEAMGILADLHTAVTTVTIVRYRVWSKYSVAVLPSLAGMYWYSPYISYTPY